MWGQLIANQLHNEEEKPLESLIATTLRWRGQGGVLTLESCCCCPIWGRKSYRAVALATPECAVFTCDLPTCANWKTVRTDFSHFTLQTLIDNSNCFINILSATVLHWMEDSCCCCLFCCNSCNPAVPNDRLIANKMRADISGCWNCSRLLSVWHTKETQLSIMNRKYWPKITCHLSCLTWRIRDICN